MAPEEPEGQSSDDLGFDPLSAADWFVHEVRTAYTFVAVPEDTAQRWSEALSIPIRRCYIGGGLLPRFYATDN
jgi:hypothetical protein